MRTRRAASQTYLGLPSLVQKKYLLWRMAITAQASIPKQKGMQASEFRNKTVDQRAEQPEQS